MIVSPDLARLAAYDRVCGFRLRDELPPTYPHVLAFPLAVSVLRKLPVPLLGLVHIENRIECVRPLQLGERLDLSVRAADPELHPRGTQFVLHTTAAVAGTVVWRERSTYLRRTSGGSGSRHEDPPARFAAVWDVAGDVGRRYASVSGDWNPIHLHNLTARLFGQRGAIAHGMWTAARCVAALEGVLGETCEVEVRFRRPVRLGTRVGFSWDANDFSVWDVQTRACLVTGKAH
jgi:MaoC like domain